MSYFNVKVISVILFLFVLVTAGEAHGQLVGGVELSLQGIPASVKSGSNFEARLLAKIDDGWHIYGLNKIEGGPIPTRIDLAAGQPFTLAGEIESPVPVVDRDSAFPVDVEFYEGQAEFKLPIRVTANTRAAKHNLIVSVRYQMCNKEVCKRPNVVEVSVPIAVTSRAKPSKREQP